MTSLRWQAEQLRTLPSLRARLRFVWWVVVCRWETEMCDDCGGRIMPHTASWWHADDELWLEVVGDSLGPISVPGALGRVIGPGTLCPPCFTARAAAKGIRVFWHAREEYRDGQDVEEGQRRAGLRA